MMGVDVMHKGFHFGECRRFPLLTHNVFNAFSESRIIAVLEDTFIPAGADSEMVEFNIIFYNMPVIMHLEVIDSVFSISGGVCGTKLSLESLDKVGPIIKPVGNVIGVKEGWLKEFQGGPSEVGKCKGHLVRVIRINGIAAEKEIAKENEIVELSGFRTVKSIGFLGLVFWIRASQWWSCSVKSIIASAKLGARLLRVSACRGSSKGKSAHGVALLAEWRGDILVLQEEFVL